MSKKNWRAGVFESAGCRVNRETHKTLICPAEVNQTRLNSGLNHISDAKARTNKIIKLRGVENTPKTHQTQRCRLYRSQLLSQICVSTLPQIEWCSRCTSPQKQFEVAWRLISVLASPWPLLSTSPKPWKQIHHTINLYKEHRMQLCVQNKAHIEKLWQPLASHDRGI